MSKPRSARNFLRKGALTSVAVAAVIVVLVAVVGLGVYVMLNQSQTPSTVIAISQTTTSVIAPSTESSSSTYNTFSNYTASAVETTNSAFGLKLVLSVNSKVIQSGQGVNVSLSIINVLSTENNVSSANNWTVKDLPQECNNYIVPNKIGVYRGYYSATNATSATPLYVWPLHSCPADYAFNGTSDIVGVLQNVTSYAFLPNSASASFAAYYATSPCSGNPCTASAMISHHGIFLPESAVEQSVIYATNRTAGQLGGLPSFLSSLPAVYTIVGCDEWGQIVLLHVKVSGNTGPIQQTTSSSVYCGQSGPSQVVYVKIVSDEDPNSPIQGANVSGSLSINCGGGDVSYQIEPQMTPSNGTVLFQVIGCGCSIGNYTVIIQMDNATYSVFLSPPMLHLSQVVVATIGMPSAKVIGMRISNSAICFQNSTTVTNGTGFFC